MEPLPPYPVVAPPEEDLAPPPPPLVEDAPPKLVEQSDLLEIAEGNVVSAGAVFVASIVLDALTALPTTIVVDVPTSLRTTALVLAALVAAPPVEADFLFEQRGLACLLLVATAFYGLHNGGVNARIADALYSLLCGWAVLLIFGVAGPKPGDRGHDAKGKRENVIALSAAFLGYAGARIVRSALYHPGEVTGFTASHEDIEARGYGVADDLVASTLVFGGTLCVCAAGIILLNHDAIYEHGCEPVATVIAQLSVLIFSAAFVVQVACFARLDELEALFGDSACVGDIDVCANSFRARRLYTANSSPAALWACAVGLTIFAFPYDRRCRTRRDYFVHPEDPDEIEAATGSGNVALAASVVAVVVVYAYADSLWPALELLLLFFSIPAAWYSSTWIACALHAAGMLVYTVGRLGEPLWLRPRLSDPLVRRDDAAPHPRAGRHHLHQLAALRVVRLDGAVHPVAREHHGAAHRGLGVDPALPDDRVARDHQRLRRLPHEHGQLALGELAMGHAAQPRLLLCRGARGRAVRVPQWAHRQMAVETRVVRGARRAHVRLGVHALRLVQLRAVRHHGRRHVHRHRHARRAAAVGHRRRGHVLTRMTRITVKMQE